MVDGYSKHEMFPSFKRILNMDDETIASLAAKKKASLFFFQVENNIF